MLARPLTIFLLATVLTTGSGHVLTAEETGHQETSVKTPDDKAFDWTGTVTCTLFTGNRTDLALDTTNGPRVVSRHDSGPVVEAGAVIRVQGTFQKPPLPSQRLSYPRATNLIVVGRGPAPQPANVTISDIHDDLHHWRFSRIRGILRDVHLAENNSRWRTMRLCAPDGSIYVSGPATRTDPRRIENLLGREITVDGFPVPSNGTGHAYTGPHFHIANDRALHPVSQDDADPFEAPSADDLFGKRPEFIAHCGNRRICGRVICTWGGNRALVRTLRLNIVQLELKSNTLPTTGTCIEASGLPATDLYRLSLVHAVWRPSASSDDLPDEEHEEVCAVSAREVLKKEKTGQLSVSISYDGKRTCMSGIVRQLPYNDFGGTRMLLEDQDTFFFVDVGNASDFLTSVTRGCRIEATGICLLEKDLWHPGLSVPRISGLSLIVSRPDDLRIVARPPWWTPSRLWIAVGILLAALAIFVVWNQILHKLVERRGRALYRSQIEQATAELKTTERTRLAVELHDSISQNLSGVSLQIDAASRLVNRDRDETVQHLNIASKTLRSCREELRNCIWDLRNQTVDEHDLNEAIRRSLRRLVGNAEMFIRFNVPRQKLSDNTVYILLRIIRELATNAVRHGHASVIKIAGALDDGHLLFSVTDNGCGFNPENRPGVSDGHFGLQGVSERIKDLGGTMKIESSAGKGTRVCIKLRS